jgi:hypothetical protein
LVVQRDPITTAKEVASLDHLSGGRFEFGIGAGWNREEMVNHGTDFDTRFSLMAERVAAMKEIWTQDEASHHGEHVSFERIWSYPKPIQRPHPPVLLGAVGAKAVDRVLAYGDGWLPLPVPGMPDRIRELHRRARVLSRPVQVYLFAAPTDPRELTEYAEAGVDRFIFEIPRPAGARSSERSKSPKTRWRRRSGPDRARLARSAASLAPVCAGAPGVASRSAIAGRRLGRSKVEAPTPRDRRYLVQIPWEREEEVSHIIPTVAQRLNHSGLRRSGCARRGPVSRALAARPAKRIVAAHAKRIQEVFRYCGCWWGAVSVPLMLGLLMERDANRPRELVRRWPRATGG